MKYTNLIWDFDGMLFNTYPRMTAAFQKALSEYGIYAPHDEVLSRIKRIVGGAAALYAEAHGLDKQTIFDRYQVHEHAMPDDTIIPYDGMCDLLRDARAAGYRHFLYTHRDHTALSALRRHGVYDLFSDFVTELDGFPSKPAPDALLHILSKNQLDPAASLMLGDRSIDILAARNAGLRGCLFDPEHFYDDFENDLRTDSVEGLRRILGINQTYPKSLPLEGKVSAEQTDEVSPYQISSFRIEETH